MSDDRFKEARRSLIDRQNEGDEESGSEEQDDEKNLSDAETQLVDLDRLPVGQRSEQDLPRRDPDAQSNPPRGSDSFGETRDDRDTTDQFEPDDSRRRDRRSSSQNPAFGQQPSSGTQEPLGRRQDSSPEETRPSPGHPQRGGNPRQRHPSGQQRSVDQQRNQGESRQRQTSNEHPSFDVQPREQEQFDDTTEQGGRRRQRHESGQFGSSPADSANAPSISVNPENQPIRSKPDPPEPSNVSGPLETKQPGTPEPSKPKRPEQKVFVPGDSSSSKDEKTAFVNLNDFADESPDSATFTPDEREAGHKGSTQFVDINSLMGSEDGSKSGSGQSVAIEDDEILAASYDYTDADIDRGDINLIYAFNAADQPIILRQVWSGNADEMPAEMRQRINRIDHLSIPNLTTLNGMVISESGAWVEIDCPQGRRMSTILNDRGPQELDRVLTWIRSIGRALSSLHEAGLVYANLTPDAVWVDDEDNAVLEPFDMVCLEDRGDLGQFGPPEMKAQPDDRQLSPATDVYSLAAVTLAGLTGIPLHPERVAALDSEEVTRAVRDAVIDAPRERIQSVEAFIGQLDVDSYSLSDRFDPAELDFKVLLGATLALMAAVTGVLFYLRGMPAALESETAPKMGQNKPTTPETASGGVAAEGQSEDDRAASEKAETAELAADAPGEYITDPRLEVQTSYRFNPPATEEEQPESDEAIAEKTKKLRETAEKKMKEAAEADEAAKKKLLTKAAESITRAIRLEDEGPSADEKKLLDELYGHEALQKYYEKLVERIYENIASGAIGEARFAYDKLSSITTAATAGDFFAKVSSAKVERIEASSEQDTGKKPGEKEEAGDED